MTGPAARPIEVGLGTWIEKSWGWFRTLFRDDQVEIVEAEIVAGGYSSQHKHLYKSNTFQVITGELEVQTYPASLKPTKYVLTPTADSITIPAFVPHKFFAPQATRLIETYVASQRGRAIEPDDIVRFSDGGIRK
jgi:mannose-6-phosphate isomerase-like protein (cupin superfamily)